MSKSSIHVGLGSIRVGDSETRELKNFDGGTDVLDAAVNSVIASRRAVNTTEIILGAMPLFRRHSKMRYDKDSRYLGNAFHEAGQFAYWCKPHSYTDPLPQYSNRRQGQTTNVQVPVDNDGLARVTALGAVYGGIDKDNIDLPDSGALPLNRYGLQHIYSWMDIPGITIGSAFLHQADVPNSRYFYVDSGDNALSQGAVEFGGHVDYPSARLNHHIYQVYITKSGGTGTATGTSGTDGGPTDADTFHSAGYTFLAGDIGKFIKVTDGKGEVDEGVYEILAITGGDADTDASTVKQPFNTFSVVNVVWEMITGPIAEYFWRRRPYSKYDRPSRGLSSTYGSVPVYNTINEIRGTADIANRSATAIVNDGAGNYWCLNAYMNGQSMDTSMWPKALYRYTQMSPQGFDPTYEDDDITDMPAGITYWRDMNVDADHFIWVAWHGAPDAPDADKRLAKIHPYPGAPADARYPEAVGTYEAQAGADDATGLCSDDPIGVLCDYENSVTWIFHDTGARLGTDQDDGGISYTPDAGTTWKRLHRLHTVTGADTFDVAGTALTRNTGSVDMTTVFAAGDWVRIGSDTYSHEIASVDSATAMTLSTAHGGATAETMQKGALAADEAVAHYGPWSGTPASHNVSTQARCVCDFDRDGNIYWLASGRTLICKWSPTDGRVYRVLESELPSDGHAFGGGQLRSLVVSRLPQFANLGTSELDENIWIASVADGVARIPKANFEFVDNSAAIDGAFADAGGGKVIVTSTGHGLKNDCEIQISGTTNYNGFYTISSVATDTFEIVSAYTAEGAAGTWAIVVTKYHDGVADNWPLTVDIASTTDVNGAMDTVVDETSGQIYLLSAYTTGEVPMWCVTMQGSDVGLMPTRSAYSTPSGDGSTRSERCYAWQPALAQHFGRDGTSQGLMTGIYYDDHNHIGVMLHHGPWTCLGWDGSTWEIMLGNQHDVDLDFDQDDGFPGPHMHDGGNLALGSGIRRAFGDWQELELGLNVRFTQDGGVAQANEFVIDEQTTVPVYVGWGKDNISDAEYSMGLYFSPTILRQGVEAGGEAANPWTVEGPDFETMGVDGGWEPDSAVEQTTPDWGLGVAMPVSLAGYGYGGFIDFVSTYGKPAPAPEAHFMACLRIKPEGEWADDYSVAVGSDVFTTAGAHTFAAGDMGKTIEIEDSTVGTFDNNGGYVIIAYLTPTTVQVDRNFPATENAGAARRWKLIDIPAVGYVEFRASYSDQPYVMAQGMDWKLYSSGDRGEVWGDVKKMLRTEACTDDEDLSTYEDDDVFISGISGWSAASNGVTVIFDLTALDHVARRKTYWKVWRRYYTANQYLRHAGLILRDENFKILGAPTNLKCADADDPKFLATYLGNKNLGPTTRKLAVHDPGGDQIQTVDDGDGDGYTNLLQLVSGSLYETNGTNGITTTGASEFSAPSAATATGTTIGGTSPEMLLTVAGGTFLPAHVGKQLNIAGATTGANNGTFTITDYVSATQVKYYNRIGVAEAYTGTATLYPFSQADVGKQIRIPAGVPSGGGDYYGFVTITSVLDALTVGINIDLNDTSGLTWALLGFGYGDRVFLDDGYFLPTEYAETRDLLPTVIDVPTATTLTLAGDSVPLVAPLTTGVDFSIVREFPDSVDWHCPGYSSSFDFSTNLCGYWDPRTGVYFHADQIEFVELSGSPIAGCSTLSDSDGDGRVKFVSVPVDLNGPGFNQVVPGDYIEVSGTGIGKRMFEIKEIPTTSSPSAVVVYLDELPPSLSGLSCRLLRRRFWKARTLKSTTTTNETIT